MRQDVKNVNRNNKREAESAAFRRSRLARIENWEQLAIAAEFQPAKLAALCGTCPRQLERFFAWHFQKTPRRWLRELQCQKAKQFIAQGYSTKAVKTELNFTSDSHFCREFKKFFGVPPQTFAPQPSRNVARRQ